MKRFFFISAIGVLAVFLCPVSGYSVQYGRPIADVTNVNWTVAPLWEKLDEVVPDDAVTEIDTYITAVPTLAYFTVKLSPVTDPQSADNHVIRYRAHYSSRSGSSSMRGYLYQGGTLISAEPSASPLTTARTTYNWTLSTEEASSITDYDDLRLKLELVNPVPSVRVYCTWLEFEVPDVQPINWSDWAYKMKIRFRGYTKPTTLKSFPVLIVLNESIPDFRYRQFESPAGNDLRFTDAQTNELNYEIESWDTNGSSYVWVQMPSLVDSNDYIYARWGNEIETTPPGYTADGTVWTNGYAGVWHLDEKSGIHYDSTENNNNGTPYNGVDQDEPGQINGADRFDGLNDTVKVLDSASLDVSSKLTISAWFKLNDWNRQAVIARKSASYRFYNRDLGSGSGPYAMTLKLQGVTPGEANHAASNYSNGQWYYCVGTYDSAGGANNLKLYRNGVQVAATTASGSITVSADDLYFGSTDGIEDRFPGIIDEVRVCGVTRSADWIWACWLNQASNTVFCEFGPIDGVALPPEISNSGGATGITHNSAFLNGNLLSRGGTNSYAFVYWGDTDQVTNKLLWATTINMGLVTEGAFSTNVTGLIPNKPYYYRCRATNVYGEGWAGSSSCFTSLAPVVQFTAASSSGAESVSPVNIQLQLSDPSTHWQDVSVNYAVIGGTASNGVDYMLAAGTATISIGNTTTNITLTVTNDTMDEYDETIIIRLSSPVNGTIKRKHESHLYDTG